MVDEPELRVLTQRIDAWCAGEGIAPGVRTQLAAVYIPLAARIARARAEHGGRRAGRGHRRARRGPANRRWLRCSHASSRTATARAARGSRSTTFIGLTPNASSWRARSIRCCARAVFRARTTSRSPNARLTRCSPRVKAIPVRVPRFDKAHDDCAPETTWPVWHGLVEVVLFEGWCLGARPKPKPRCVSRSACSRQRRRGCALPQLRQRSARQAPYRALFARIELQVSLAAPDMQRGARRRTQQEHELGRALADRARAMSDPTARRVSCSTTSASRARCSRACRNTPTWCCASRPTTAVASVESKGIVNRDA